MRLFAGVDQGTSGTRTVLVDEDGRAVASAYRRSATAHPAPGWDEQDGAALVRAIEETVAEASAAVPGASVAGVGIANQGETVIAFDRRTGEALSPAILWSDRRAADIVSELAGTPSQALVEERTGLPLDPYFSAGKIAWMLRTLPQVRRAAEAGRLAVGTLDAYFAFRLTRGAAFITDPSTASRTQLMDLDRLRFDDGCAAAFGIDAALLPAVTTTVLPEPIPTTLGPPLRAISCDQQAALAAIGATRRGDVKVTYGTGCFIEANAGSRAARPRNGLMATFGWALPGGERAWALEGGVFSAATAVDWLVSLGIAEDPAAVSALAAGTADRESEALFLPSFTGVGAPWWRPGAAGVLACLRASTSAADLARAVLEGIAHRVADVVDAVGREQGLPAELRVDGGLSASEPLLRLQADLCGLPVLPALERETTAAGVAAYAAIGAGCADLATVAARARFAPPVEPRLPRGERSARRARWTAFVGASAALDPDRLRP
jgi:glycerol kinase